MSTVADFVKSLLHPEHGATAVEYALMASLIAVVIVGAVTALGLNLDALFSDPDLHSALGT